MEILTLIKLTIMIGWIAAAYIFCVADKISKNQEKDKYLCNVKCTSLIVLNRLDFH